MSAAWYEQPTWQPNKSKKPEPQKSPPQYSSPQAGYPNSHSVAVGYLFWVFGFTGAHRFYYGKTASGVLWFCTFGLLGIGWIIDAFLIPSMNDEANRQYRSGYVDYSLTWLLLVIAGFWGAHRLYQAKVFTGLLYLMTGGLFGIGFIYDVLTLNDQIDELNADRFSSASMNYA